MLERFFGSSWVYVAIALSGFAAGAATGGWTVYQMWSVDSLQSDLAAAKKDVEAEKAEKAMAEAALAAQVRATMKAREIAAQNAADAAEAEAAKAQKEMDLASFAAELEAERAKEPAACSCRLSERERQRLYDRFPVARPGVSSPGDPAASGVGRQPVQGPRHRP